MEKATELEELFTEMAAEVGAAVARSSVAEFRRGTVLFATASGGLAEFRLDPEVVDAVLQTPSTGPSPRGRDWVSLRAEVGDSRERDRAQAWFRSAWRNADG